MSMDYPTHPGISIREGCLAGELTVTEAARMLGVARHTLSRVLNGHFRHLTGDGHSPREGRVVKC